MMEELANARCDESVDGGASGASFMCCVVRWKFLTCAVERLLLWTSIESRSTRAQLPVNISLHFSEVKRVPQHLPQFFYQLLG